MLHSTITKKGQTTIPNEIRVALNIHPGDRLEYKLEGKRVSMQVHPGTRSLAGTLASTKGKDLSFSEIRKAAQAVAKKSNRHD
jgi:AbrB family looped-hinge helix DNA binding protein